MLVLCSLQSDDSVRDCRGKPASSVLKNETMIGSGLERKARPEALRRSRHNT